MLSERELGLLVQRPTDRDQLGLKRSAVPDELPNTRKAYWRPASRSDHDANRLGYHQFLALSAWMW